MKYKVVKEDDNYVFETLSDAYQFIDSDAEIATLTDYIQNKLADISAYNQFSDFINNLSELMNAIDPYVQDDQDVNEIFIATIGDSKDVIFLDNAFFIPVFNSLLENFEYDAYIVKNNEMIKQELKKYLMNHVEDFLKITIYFINHGNQLNCIMWTDNRIDNSVIQTVCNDKYDKDDPYNVILNGILYSATEFDVLNEFMKDFDNIIDLIIEHIDELSQALNKELSREFFQIVL